ncbi:uncharacterized protein MONBRDRAFT_22968 [Monosiga brevicollis MX1]|uniref:Uncharacterized protein n=1 Tax=Monosiga brevicollis TaxID=81824 RepID=A9USM0_MONBE|nr:uncharacterized protein MONBRDRAFT_22968 [Monosiga brevicollis MX1]EDQ92125.1 predicted protein [Monosiga brevicollis MX1]|eukprot:XP_001743411.1 hypothetical protein [Monosiga brevicollis MX1]
MAAKALLKTADASAWQAQLDAYDERIKTRYQGFGKARQKVNLPEHDRWLWQDLPHVVAARKEPHITLDELVQIMEWKLSRGQSRPLLKRLKAHNTAENVVAVSTRAFAELQAKRKAGPEVALRAVCTILQELPFVGPATASAILAPLYPQDAPFMSDEALLTIPEVRASDYSLNNYLALAVQLDGLRSHLKLHDWSLADLEKAIWSATQSAAA